MMLGLSAARAGPARNARTAEAIATVNARLMTAPSTPHTPKPTWFVPVLTSPFPRVPTMYRVQY